MAERVVAERDHVGADREQVLAGLLGDPEPAGGVLAVDDHQVGRDGARAARASPARGRPGPACRPRRRRTAPSSRAYAYRQSRSVPPVSGRAADGAPVIEARELGKSFGDRAALREVSFEAAPGELLAVIGPERRRQDDPALDPRRDPRARRGRGLGRPARSAGCRSRRRSTGGSPWPRTCACSPASSGSTTSTPRSSGCSSRPGSASAATTRSATLSGGNQQRVNIAIGLLAAPAVLLLDEPSTGLDPRQRERLWEFVLGLAGAGTTVIYSTHHLLEAERYGDRLLVLADGERVFDGTAERAPRGGPGRRRARLRGRVRPLPARAGPLSDALAAAQGPADPAPLAADRRPADRLSGRARGADRVRALRRQLEAAGRVPQPGPRRASSSRSAAATSEIDRDLARDELCSRVECVDVDSREEAEQKVEDGDVIAALILPAGPARQARLARHAQPAAADGRGARQRGRPGQGEPRRRPDPGADHRGQPDPRPADLRPGGDLSRPADRGRRRSALPLLGDVDILGLDKAAAILERGRRRAAAGQPRPRRRSTG